MYDLFDAFDAMDAAFNKCEKYAVPSFPPCEVQKRKDGTVDIFLAIAGYEKENIGISTEENKLVVSTVEGYEAPKVAEGVTVLSTNRIKRSPFKTSFLLPETKFNFNEITATFKDGILSIVVPPKEKKEYKQIEIG